MTAILETRSLSYVYPGGQKALKGVDFVFEKGSRNAVLGPNGAGKSTLFLLLNGVLKPSKGQILFDGVPLVYDRSGLKRIRSQVGVLFQDPDAQLISASLWEDVSFGPMNLGLDRETVKRRVEAALHAVHLENLADRPVHAMSYGQKKRAGLAGLLAMEPEVLILDEPTSGLDNRARGEFLDLLAILNQQNITVILSTHSMDLAYAWADKAYVLEDGLVVEACASETFPQAFPGFDRYGLGVPSVLQIHNALTEKGLLSKTQAGPRDHRELIKVIQEAPTV